MAICKKIIITLLMVLLTFLIFNLYNKAHCMDGVTNVVLPGHIAERQAAFDAAMAEAGMGVVGWQKQAEFYDVEEMSTINYKPGDNPGNSQDSTLWPGVSWDEESGKLVENSVVKNNDNENPSVLSKGVKAVSCPPPSSPRGSSQPPWETPRNPTDITYPDNSLPGNPPAGPIGRPPVGIPPRGVWEETPSNLADITLSYPGNSLPGNPPVGPPPEDDPIPPRLVSFDLDGRWCKPIAWPIDYINNTSSCKEPIGMPNPCWPVPGYSIVYSLAGIAPGETIPCPPPVIVPGRKAV